MKFKMTLLIAFMIAAFASSCEESNGSSSSKSQSTNIEDSEQNALGENQGDNLADLGNNVGTNPNPQASPSQDNSGSSGSSSFDVSEEDLASGAQDVIDMLNEEFPDAEIPYTEDSEEVEALLDMGLDEGTVTQLLAEQLGLADSMSTVDEDGNPLSEDEIMAQFTDQFFDDNLGELLNSTDTSSDDPNASILDTLMNSEEGDTSGLIDLLLGLSEEG